MREKELLLYRDFDDADLFYKMSKVMDEGTRELADDVADPGSRHIRDDICECIHLLLEQAGENGFYGNLWHDYLTSILVNHENSYSLACEMRGDVEGSAGMAALHDIGIFKEYFDFDFTKIIEGFDIPEFSLVLDYKQPSHTGSSVKTDLSQNAAESGNIQLLSGDNDYFGSLSCNDICSVNVRSHFKISAASLDGSRYNRRIRDRICQLAKDFEQAGSPEVMKKQLSEFYRDYGVGKFGLHKAFRVEYDEVGPFAGITRIEPIRKILHVSMKDLVGYERAKQKLIDNTEAFVSGRPANNVLLYGEAGTGKSSSIKALANEYYDRGLRIIQVNRYQFRNLDDVIAQIKNRNYWFILYMDDLSFEENETEYKYLKAVIEGGLEKKPSNVLMYATSNRRHLIRESFHDRSGQDAVTYGGATGYAGGGPGRYTGTGSAYSGDASAGMDPAMPGGDDKHYADTVQEKLSLANRFGVTIYYGAPSFEEYHEIVSELADRNGITMDKKELRQQATRWEMTHGGLSGRTAQQYIDYLLGAVPQSTRHGEVL